MRYKYLGGKVPAETKKKGRTEQTEIYIPMLEDGEWLIDEVIERDEVEIEELEESPREWPIEM